MQMIPLSKTANIYLEYNDGSLRVGMCQWNNNMRCWVADISYLDVSVTRVPLRAGVNLLRQYGFTFAILIVNKSSPGEDPGSFRSISAYLIEPEEIGDFV